MILVLRPFALALILIAAPAEAKTRSWFPHEAGECGWVHGRYAVYNGSGIRRIWVIGTRHMLNLIDDDDTAPAELDARNWSGSDGPANEALYGDFFVCARERYRRGHMQHIYVRRVRHLMPGPFQL